MDTLKNYNTDSKELISGLSLFFRRIEKYPIFLQEIERNTFNHHPDKGNLQRAAITYRNIFVSLF